MTIFRTKNLNDLTMRLQGNIEAAVNGGVAKYIKAFFRADFEGGPSDFNLVECLAAHLETLSSLLAEGLHLHGQLASEPLQPLQERLVEKYSEMKERLVAGNLMAGVGRPRVASIVNTPLPPLPRLHQEQTEAERENNLDNCYHEVVIGETGDNTRTAPPLPPRGVKTSLTFSPGAGDLSYVKMPPAVPHRQSSLHAGPSSGSSGSSPPPLLRKHSAKRSQQPPPVPPKSVSTSETGSEG